MKRLPKFLKKYFWDMDFERLDFQKHRLYVLNRILNYGDKKAVVWTWKNFKRSEIKYVVSNFRDFSQKSANFWSLILNLPKGKVQYLKIRSSKEPKPLWHY